MRTRLLWWLVALITAASIGAVAALWLTDTDPGRTPATLMTAAIALLVAGITALTTDGRQERQLAHEERALGARFAHERIMEDLQELRKVLDEARAAAVALTDIRWPELVNLSQDDDPDAGFTLAMDWRASHMAALKEQGRLALRLGEEHEVTEAYDDALHALFESVRDIRQMARDGRTDLVDSRAKEGINVFEDALRDFTEKARRRVGAAQAIVGG